MTTCAICLNPVRATRNNVPIRCGHLFHSHCIESWRQSGKHTCPVCRKIFDGSVFKLQLTLHNIVNETSNTLTADPNFSLEVLDAIFYPRDLVDLDSLLMDFGVSVTDFDPLVLNTE